MSELSLQHVHAEWFHTPEDHPVKHVIRALKANLFHDDYEGDEALTRALLKAYWTAVSVQNEVTDKETEPPSLTGNEAYQWCMAHYAATSKTLGARSGFVYDDNTLSERFHWPDALPSECQIPRWLLRVVAERMATIDVHQDKQWREYFASRDRAVADSNA